MISPTARFVLAALSEFPGSDRDEILSLIEKDWNANGFSDTRRMPVLMRVLNNLEEDGAIVCSGGRYYLPTHAPAPVAAPAPSREPVAASAGRHTIADFYRARRSASVSMEHAPQVAANVHEVSLIIGGNRIPLPPGDYRMCISGEIPTWDPAQITYRGVSAIVCVYADGREETYNHLPTHPLAVLRVG